PLLVDLDRVDAAVRSFIVVLGDRVLKCLMHFTEAMLKNFAETNQNRQRDTAKLEIVDQLLKIERAIRIFVGMHPQVSVRADGEVAFSPAGNVVEIGGLGCGPAVGRFAHRSSVSEYCRHEISVSFDLTRRAREKIQKNESQAIGAVIPS